MNSAQLRAALKTMTDFAPALMRAQEILDACDQAEAKIETAKEQYTEAEKQLIELKTVVTQHEATVQQLEQTVAQAKQAADATKRAIEEELEAAKQDVADKRREVAGLTNEYEAKAKLVDDQYAIKLSELEDIKREISNIRQHLAVVPM